MTHPPPKIINIFDVPNDKSDIAGVELATQFDLDRISIRYLTLPQSQKTIEVPIMSKINLMCYVITGTGTLSMGSESTNVKQDDCFSFVASELAQSLSFTLTAESDNLSLLIVSDIIPQDHFIAKELQSTPEFPTIVSAKETCTWRQKGIDTTKDIRLTSFTGMSKLMTRPWGFVREQIPPGTQSSNAHCHSADDEFALILEGKARYWYQGITPEPVLRPGDCVGWKAGTGICHSLLNDSEDGTGKGEDLVFLVWGESHGDGDKLYYATTSPHWWTSSCRWFERPDLPQGSASGCPKFPRPDDASYPS